MLRTLTPALSQEEREGLLRTLTPALSQGERDELIAVCVDKVTHIRDDAGRGERGIGRAFL